MVNNIYIIYLKQTPAHSQGNDHGIETGKEVVSHAPPTAVDMLVNPTATERFGNVEDAEKDETQRGEGNDLPSGSLEKTYSQTCHPGAERFVDDNGTALKAARQYPENTPASGIEVPSNPSKPSTAQYSYAFSGWSPPVETVSRNVTYRATYQPTIRQYTVTWKNVHGKGNNDIVTTQVPFGVVPSYNNAIPQIRTNFYVYVFDRWDTTPTQVTGDATYSALFKVQKRVISSDSNHVTISPSQISLSDPTPDAVISNIDLTVNWSLSHESHTLRKGTDYVVTCTLDSTSTRATLTITGRGDYEGALTLNNDPITINKPTSPGGGGRH